MAQDGLQGRQKRRTKRTTIPAAQASPLWTDLVARDFAPANRPLNQVWAGDITYIRTWEGWAYLATVVDLASRRVVGFSVADHMRASLVEDALKMALQSRRPAPGLIFHSARGSQYTSAAFRELPARIACSPSTSRRCSVKPTPYPSTGGGGSRAVVARQAKRNLERPTTLLRWEPCVGDGAAASPTHSIDAGGHEVNAGPGVLGCHQTKLEQHYLDPATFRRC